ncbi:hypothetical protein BG011_002747 [Mortierella polycephala]|uniref:Uncharacterized protein n=1 Tax=Mortierella polycephala TaxID=41804 RepID=A0A9P6Q2N1_9FUNG|nr:hypothetical protein BG011_002747 [Mortierella polycephala]
MTDVTGPPPQLAPLEAINSNGDASEAQKQQRIFQAFRSIYDSKPVWIPVVRHPSTNERYVIWSDVADCFPGVVRVQHDDYFVPLMRDSAMYRGPSSPSSPTHQPQQQRRANRKRRTKLQSNILHNYQNPSTTTTSTDLPGTLGSSKRDIDWSDETNFTTEAAYTAFMKVLKRPVSKVGHERKHKVDEIAEEIQEVKEMNEHDNEGGFENHGTRLRGTEPAGSDEGEEGEGDDTDDFEDDAKSTKAGDDSYAGEALAGDEQPGDKIKGIQDRYEKGKRKTGMDTESGTQDEEAASMDQQSCVQETKGAISEDGYDTNDEEKVLKPKDFYESVALYRRSVEDLAFSTNITNEHPLTISGVVGHRVKAILQKRYHWLNSRCSKLFFILPVDDNESLKAEMDADASDNMTCSDFRIQFCCDCGGVYGPWSELFLHWDTTGGELRYTIKKHKQEEFLKTYGEYIMGVVEILKYGVRLNGIVLYVPHPDQEIQKRLSLSLKFLQSQGFPTSKQHFRLVSGHDSATLATVKPILPLDEKDMMALPEYFDTPRGVYSFGGMNAYLTTEGDVRWVSLIHLINMSPDDELKAVMDFSKHPASQVSEFDGSLGAFRAIITTRERARDFYALAGKLTTICALRLFLDWEITQQDLKELQHAMAKIQAAVVKVMLRREPNHRRDFPIFDSGFAGVVMEALVNKRIEAFLIEHGSDDPPSVYGYNERHCFDSSMTDGSHFLRDTITGKLKVNLHVPNIDNALTMLRSTIKGLHHLSELKLTLDFWKSIEIKFIKPGQPGSEIVDKNYMASNPALFFANRGGLDTINYTCHIEEMIDLWTLRSTALVDLHVGYSFAKNRNLIRDAIKMNRNLRALHLWNDAMDDPSQVYEAYKSIMANHPTLTTFEIQQKHAPGCLSEFQWRNMSDRAKMTVSVRSHPMDKIANVLQKYPTLISTLNMDGLPAQDAAVLEKSFRPKKGPFKLHDLSISDPESMEIIALEDLKKVIMRGNIPGVRVYCGYSMSKEKINPSEENANKVVDFVMAIRPKITEFNIYGEWCSLVIKAIEDRLMDSVSMPRLTSLTLMSESQQPLKLPTWVMLFLAYKSRNDRMQGLHADPPVTIAPLKTIFLSHFEVSEAEWMAVMTMIDFEELKELRLTLAAPISQASLMILVDRIPAVNKLQSISIEAPSLDDKESIQCANAIYRKVDNKHVAVMINRYINDFY